MTRSTTYWKDQTCQIAVYQITQEGTVSVGASRDGDSRNATFAADHTESKSDTGSSALAQTPSMNPWNG